MSQVAILGVGRAGYEESVSDKSLNELVYAATRRALDDAGIDRSQVDSVVLAAHDVDDGRGITSMTVAGAAGAFMKDEVRVAEDGTFGLVAASSRLMTGHFSVSLVVSWGKASESDQDAITQLGFEPFFDRPIAQNEKIALALQAGAYRSAITAGGDVDDTADRWVSARRAAAPGHRAEKAPDSPSRVCTPLDAWSIADDSDGACAVVLARSDAPEVRAADPLWLLGAGWSSDPHHLGTRGFGAFPALREATRTALSRSSITSAERLDVVELDSPTPYHEMMGVEALGLCAEGQGAAFVADALTHGSGPRMGVHGGAFGWKPLAASGLARFIDVVDALRSGEASVGMAHGSSGTAWQSHCLCLVGTNPSGKDS